MKKEQFKLVFLSLVLVLLIDHVYITIITEYFNGNIASFGMYGYPKGTFSIIRFIIVIALIYLLSFIVPLKINSPSSLTLSIYYYIAIVPYLSFYTIRLSATESVFYIDVLSIYIFYTITKLFIKNSYKKSFNLIMEKKFELSAFVIMFSSIILLVFLYFSFGKNSSIGLSNILDVYGQRESFANSAGFLGSLISGYIIYGAIPFLIFMYKKNNSYYYIIIALFLGFLTFLTTGSKLFLGSTFLMIFLTIKFVNNFSHTYIGIFLFVLVLLSDILANMYNSLILVSLFVRRMLITPAQIFGLYYEHVNNFGFNYLAKYTASITGHEQISLAHELGDKYYRLNAHINNGIISDAYGNFGLIGVVIYSFFFVLVFQFANKLNQYYNLLLTPLFIGLAISLTNSSLLAVTIYQISMLLIIFKIYSIMKRIKI